MLRDGFVDATLEEIGQAAFRDRAGPAVPLDGTSNALSLLTVEAMGRLVTFLRDLSQRPPMAGPAWLAHREVLEALVSDIERHRTLLYYDELHGEVER